MGGALATSRLRRLAQRGEGAAPTRKPERCDLCDAPIAPEHRHLLDLRDRQVACACRPCSLLFDRPGGAGHHRLIPDRRLRLDGFTLDDALWDELRVPVDMAFFFRDSVAGRVAAFYPSPMGPTESLLRLEAWAGLEERNPVLRELEPDVEALLVNRARGVRQQFLVPIDDCYRLVGLIRTRWRGFTGGREVWEAIRDFFDELERTATAAPSAAGRT